MPHNQNTNQHHTTGMLPGVFYLYRKLWEKYMKTEHRTFDFTSRLHTIFCPVLYLAGENNPVHPMICATETAKLIGENCQLTIIPNTGNPVYRDKPTETLSIITTFFASLLNYVHLEF